MNNEHPHSWFFIALANGEPLSNFERAYCIAYENGLSFKPVTPSDLPGIYNLPDRFIVCRRTNIIMIGDREVPAPVSSPLNKGDEYFVITLSLVEKYIRLHWRDSEMDSIRLHRGLVFRKREEAVEAADALLDLIGGVE